MTPAQLHMSLLVLSSAGWLPSNAVGAPGNPVCRGHRDAGASAVSTPIAAAVAEATVGLAMEEHMPNGIMFTKWRQSLFFSSN